MTVKNKPSFCSRNLYKITLIMTACFKAATQKQKFEGLVFDGSIVQASKIPIATFYYVLW